MLALGGAAAGLVLALIFEFLGHTSWYILAMFGAAAVPSLVIEMARVPAIDAFRDRCHRWPTWSKYALILLLIAIALGTKRVLDGDPRHYRYVSLLGPVATTGVLFGFSMAFISVVATTLAADLVFALPQSTFALSNWEDLAGLVVFAILGAGVALTVDEFLSLGSA